MSAPRSVHHNTTTNKDTTQTIHSERAGWTWHFHRGELTDKEANDARIAPHGRQMQRSHACATAATKRCSGGKRLPSKRAGRDTPRGDELRTTHQIRCSCQLRDAETQSAWLPTTPHTRHNVNAAHTITPTQQRPSSNCNLTATGGDNPTSLFRVARDASSGMSLHMASISFLQTRNRNGAEVNGAGSMQAKPGCE